MSVNVSQKDATLREVMCLIETARANTLQAIEKTPSSATVTIAHFTGELSALSRLYNQCKDMLGYSGSMPTEVPNQSK